MDKRQLGTDRYASNAAARDPLKDPQVGDIAGPTKIWDGSARVVQREGDQVTFCVDGTTIWCPVSDWQEWMEGAEVIHVA